MAKYIAYEQKCRCGIDPSSNLKETNESSVKNKQVIKDHEEMAEAK